MLQTTNTSSFMTFGQKDRANLKKYMQVCHLKIFNFNEIKKMEQSSYYLKMFRTIYTDFESLYLLQITWDKRRSKPRISTYFWRSMKRESHYQTVRPSPWFFTLYWQLSFHQWQHPFIACIRSFHITTHTLCQSWSKLRGFVYSSRFLRIRRLEQSYVATK